MSSWHPLRIGNGGFITGIDRSPDGATWVCRADSSGAFVWNPSGSGQWDQMNSRVRMPSSSWTGGGVSEVLVAKKTGDSNIILMLKAGDAFISTDRGVTFAAAGNWTNLERILFSFNNSTKTKASGPFGGFDPNNSNIIYLATTTRGFRRSTDGGATWATVTEVSGGLVAGGFGTATLPQVGTDSTSYTAGTGSKAFTNNSAAFGFAANTDTDIKVWSASDPTVQMVGELTAASGTTFTINVDTAFGAAAGAKFDWIVSPAIRGENYVGGGHLVAFDTSAGTTSAFGKTVTKNVIVHSYGCGTFKSTDGGVTWTKIVSTGTPTSIVRWDIDAFGVLWVVDGDYSGLNIHKYDFAADTWLNFTAITGDTTWYQAVAVDPLNSSSKATVTVTFGMFDHGWFRTITDGGATATSGYAFDSSPLGNRVFDTPPTSDVDWFLSYFNAYPTQFWALGDIKYDPVNSGRVYHASEGVWYSNMPRSAPPTINLHQQSRGIEEFIPAQIISPQSGTVIVGAWDFISFRTSSFNSYPASLAGPLGNTQGNFSSLFISYGMDYNGSVAAISIGDSGNVIDDTKNTAWYSLDYGVTWTVFPTQPYPGKPPGTSIACSNDGNTFVVLPCVETYGPPRITTNRGASWSDAAMPGLTGLENWGYQQFFFPEAKMIESDKTTGDIYVYCVQDGAGNAPMFKWTKIGGAWTRINSNTGFGSLGRLFPHLKSVPGHPGHMVFAQGQTGGVLYSTNDGWATTSFLVPGFTWAYSVGIAKETSTYPAIMVYGIRSGVESYWLCTDFNPTTGTGTWTDVGATMPLLARPKDMTGDLAIPGQFYAWTSDGAMFFGDLTSATPTTAFSIIHGHARRHTKMINY